MKKTITTIILTALLTSCHTRQSSLTTTTGYTDSNHLQLSRLHLDISDSILTASCLKIDSITIRMMSADTLAPTTTVTLYNITRTDSSHRHKTSRRNSTDSQQSNYRKLRESSAKTSKTTRTASPHQLFAILFSLFLSILSACWLVKKLGSANKKT